MRLCRSVGYDPTGVVARKGDRAILTTTGLPFSFFEAFTVSWGSR